MVTNVIIALVIYLGLVGCSDTVSSQPLDVEYDVINVSPQVQGDANLVLSKGESILIDAGYARYTSGYLVPYLKARGVSHLTSAMISHPHKDHYGGFRGVLDSGITIGTMYYSMPDGLDVSYFPAHFKAELAYYKSKGVKLVQVTDGMKFDIGNAKFTVLAHYTNATSPVGTLDINDMSIVVKMEACKTVTLFTGDLNRKIGGVLALRDDIKADILKVPHHGVAGIAPIEFFTAVDADVNVINTFTNVWCSPRGSQVRNYGTTNFVTGIQGNIQVKYTHKGYTVVADKYSGVCSTATGKLIKGELNGN